MYDFAIFRYSKGSSRPLSGDLCLPAKLAISMTTRMDLDLYLPFETILADGRLLKFKGSWFVAVEGDKAVAFAVVALLVVFFYFFRSLQSIPCFFFLNLTSTYTMIPLAPKGQHNASQWSFTVKDATARHSRLCEID